MFLTQTYSDFQIDDVNPEISENARFYICELILAWATYDVSVSYWISVAFQMPLDRGAVFLGNMDTKTKLDKLVKLYTHFGEAESAKGVRALRTEHEKHVEVRNAVTHASCRGMLLSQPDRLVFSYFKMLGPGRMQMDAIHLEQLIKAATFATEAAKRIYEITDGMEAHSPAPSEPTGGSQ